MSVGFWGPIFHDYGCVRCEKGGFVDESFGALCYCGQIVV
jgi:hypothetical protein